MLLLCIIIVFEIRKCDVFQVPAKVDLAYLRNWSAASRVTQFPLSHNSTTGLLQFQNLSLYHELFTVLII